MSTHWHFNTLINNKNFLFKNLFQTDDQKGFMTLPGEGQKNGKLAVKKLFFCGATFIKGQLKIGQAIGKKG